MTDYIPPERRRVWEYQPDTAYTDSPYPDQANYQDIHTFSRDDTAYPGHADYPDAFETDSYWEERPGRYRGQPGWDWTHPERPGEVPRSAPDTTVLRALPDEASGRHDASSGLAHRESGRPQPLVGGLAGVIATTITFFVATLAAAFIGAQASPLVAMARIYIVAIPVQFRSSAAYYLGPNTQPVLLVGMCLIIEIFAVIIGVVALRRKVFGAVGIANFAMVAVFAVIAMPGSQTADVLPSAVGGLAGIVTLLYLVHMCTRYARQNPGARRHLASYGG